VPLGAAVAVAALLADAVDDEERVAFGDGGNSEGEVEALADPEGELRGRAVSLLLGLSLGVAVCGGDARGDHDAEGEDEEEGEGGEDAEKDWESLAEAVDSPVAEGRGVEEGRAPPLANAVAQAVGQCDAATLSVERSEETRVKGTGDMLGNGVGVAVSAAAAAAPKSKRGADARCVGHAAHAPPIRAMEEAGNPGAARKKSRRKKGREKTIVAALVWRRRRAREFYKVRRAIEKRGLAPRARR
jgi:hypothetical protein